jgi:hypothetical protein
MSLHVRKQSPNVFQKFFSTFFAVSFLLSFLAPPTPLYAQLVPELPPPGQNISFSQSFQPTIISGVTVNTDNPLLFDFIIYAGDDNPDEAAFQVASQKLIKYFLSALTIPDEDVWVNLSPYEKDQMIPQVLGITQMGKELLSQDYLLKQISASLTNPETELGQRFWKRVYLKAYKQYGTTDIPINTFNKVWVVPDKAVVVEKDGTALISESHLKVMLDEDYLALQKNISNKEIGTDRLESQNVQDINSLSSELIREIIIPELEREVNEGENFAQVRQMYNSIILAAWYKRSLRESLLAQVYVDQNKIAGVHVDDAEIKERIYDQYVEALKEGVYNLVKEDYDLGSKNRLNRRYFSGGLKGIGVLPVDQQQVALAALGKGMTRSRVLHVVNTSNLTREMQSALVESYDREMQRVVQARAQGINETFKVENTLFPQAVQARNTLAKTFADTLPKRDASRENLAKVAIQTIDQQTLIKTLEQHASPEHRSEMISLIQTADRQNQVDTSGNRNVSNIDVFNQELDRNKQLTQILSSLVIRQPADNLTIDTDEVKFLAAASPIRNNKDQRYKTVKVQLGETSVADLPQREQIFVRPVISSKSGVNLDEKTLVAQIPQLSSHVLQERILADTGMNPAFKNINQPQAVAITQALVRASQLPGSNTRSGLQQNLERILVEDAGVSVASSPILSRALTNIKFLQIVFDASRDQGVIADLGKIDRQAAAQRILANKSDAVLRNINQPEVATQMANALVQASQVAGVNDFGKLERELIRILPQTTNISREQTPDYARALSQPEMVRTIIQASAEKTVMTELANMDIRGGAQAILRNESNPVLSGVRDFGQASRLANAVSLASQSADVHDLTGLQNKLTQILSQTPGVSQNEIVPLAQALSEPATVQNILSASSQRGLINQMGKIDRRAGALALVKNDSSRVLRQVQDMDVAFELVDALSVASQSVGVNDLPALEQELTRIIPQTTRVSQSEASSFARALTQPDVLEDITRSSRERSLVKELGSLNIHSTGAVLMSFSSDQVLNKINNVNQAMQFANALSEAGQHVEVNDLAGLETELTRILPTVPGISRADVPQYARALSQPHVIQSVAVASQQQSIIGRLAGVDIQGGAQAIVREQKDEVLKQVKDIDQAARLVDAVTSASRNVEVSNLQGLEQELIRILPQKAGVSESEAPSYARSLSNPVLIQNIISAGNEKGLVTRIARINPQVTAQAIITNNTNDVLATVKDLDTATRLASAVSRASQKPEVTNLPALEKELQKILPESGFNQEQVPAFAKALSQQPVLQSFTQASDHTALIAQLPNINRTAAAQAILNNQSDDNLKAITDFDTASGVVNAVVKVSQTPGVTTTASFEQELARILPQEAGISSNAAPRIAQSLSRAQTIRNILQTSDTTRDKLVFHDLASVDIQAGAQTLLAETADRVLQNVKTSEQAIRLTQAIVSAKTRSDTNKSMTFEQHLTQTLQSEAGMSMAEAPQYAQALSQPRILRNITQASADKVLINNLRQVDRFAGAQTILDNKTDTTLAKVTDRGQAMKIVTALVETSQNVGVTNLPQFEQELTRVLPKTVGISEQEAPSLARALSREGVLRSITESSKDSSLIAGLNNIDSRAAGQAIIRNKKDPVLSAVTDVELANNLTSALSQASKSVEVTNLSRLEREVATFLSQKTTLGALEVQKYAQALSRPENIRNIIQASDESKLVTGLGDVDRQAGAKFIVDNQMDEVLKNVRNTDQASRLVNALITSSQNVGTKNVSDLETELTRVLSQTPGINGQEAPSFARSLTRPEVLSGITQVSDQKKFVKSLGSLDLQSGGQVVAALKGDAVLSKVTDIETASRLVNAVSIASQNPSVSNLSEFERELTLVLPRTAGVKASEAQQYARALAQPNVLQSIAQASDERKILTDLASVDVQSAAQSIIRNQNDQLLRNVKNEQQATQLVTAVLRASQNVGAKANFQELEREVARILPQVAGINESEAPAYAQALTRRDLVRNIVQSSEDKKLLTRVGKLDLPSASQAIVDIRDDVDLREISSIEKAAGIVNAMTSASQNTGINNLADLETELVRVLPTIAGVSQEQAPRIARALTKPENMKTILASSDNRNLFSKLGSVDRQVFAQNMVNNPSDETLRGITDINEANRVANAVVKTSQEYAGTTMTGYERQLAINLQQEGVSVDQAPRYARSLSKPHVLLNILDNDQERRVLSNLKSLDVKAGADLVLNTTVPPLDKVADFNVASKIVESVVSTSKQEGVSDRNTLQNRLVTTLQRDGGFSVTDAQQYAQALTEPQMLRSFDTLVAAKGDVGGIDFTAEMMNLFIEKDPNGKPLPVSRATLEQISIDGLTPQIIEIAPVTPENLPYLSEYAEKNRHPMQLSRNLD